LKLSTVRSNWAFACSAMGRFVFIPCIRRLAW